MIMMLMMVIMIMAYMSPKKENRTLACINWLDYDQGGRGKFVSERRANSETDKICWLYNEVSFYFTITFGKRKSLETRHIHVRYIEVPLACNKHQLNNSSLYIGVPTTWYRICKLSPCSKFFYAFSFSNKYLFHPSKSKYLNSNKLSIINTLFMRLISLLRKREFLNEVCTSDYPFLFLFLQQVTAIVFSLWIINERLKKMEEIKSF